MTVISNPSGTFDVVDGHRIIETGFPNIATAWRWIDRYDGEPISPSEKRTDWLVANIMGDIRR